MKLLLLAALLICLPAADTPSTVNTDLSPVLDCPVTANSFWQKAFDCAGIPEEEQIGKWIGGRARSFHVPTLYLAGVEKEWIADAASRERKRASTDQWITVAHSSVAGNLVKIRAGSSDVHVCYGHDCESEGRCPYGRCGTIGSSDPAVSDCRVYVWSDRTGIFMLMKIAEHEPACIEAYGRIAHGSMWDASTSITGKYWKIGNLEYGGVSYPVLMLRPGARLEEITLTFNGKDKTTWMQAKNLEAE